MLKLVAMHNEAHLLNGLPYVWGGGHTSPAWVVGTATTAPASSRRCCTLPATSSSPQTTQTLPGSAGIAKGPGKYVTIYDRTIATVKVWVKKKKIVTVKKAINPAPPACTWTRGRHANSSTQSRSAAEVGRGVEDDPDSPSSSPAPTTPTTTST